MKKGCAFIFKGCLTVFALFVVAAVAFGGGAAKSSSASSKGPSKSKSPDTEVAAVASDDEMAVEAAILVQKTAVLEYSRKATDLTSLVECSDADVDVRVITDVDLSVLGDQTAVFELSRGDASRNVEMTFHVQDTHAPKITTGQDYVTIQYGASYDPGENVVSVEDPVDGTAERLAEEPATYELAWYVVKGTVDTSTSGEYPITVDACDVNGNRSSKDYVVVVGPEPVQAEATSGPVSDGTGGENPFPDQGLPPATTAYVLNTNTMKFHYPSCRDVKKIAAHNRSDVDMSREEIIARGYDPCKHCNP